MAEFKIGDRVRVVDATSNINLRGMTGTVKGHLRAGYPGVEFDEPFFGGHEGHSGVAMKPGHGWFCTYGCTSLELIPPTINVGDHVRVLVDDFDDEDKTYFAGDVFEVVRVNDLGVLFMDRSYPVPRHLRLEHVELTTDPVYSAKPAVEHIVVALTPTGALTPAARPFVHPTRDGAETEAARLAVANPGQRFAVFVLLSTTVAEVAPVKTIAA